MATRNKAAVGTEVGRQTARQILEHRLLPVQIPNPFNGRFLVVIVARPQIARVGTESMNPNQGQARSGQDGQNAIVGHRADADAAVFVLHGITLKVIVNICQPVPEASVEGGLL